MQSVGLPETSWGISGVQWIWNVFLVCREVGFPAETSTFDTLWGNLNPRHSSRPTECTQCHTLSEVLMLLHWWWQWWCPPQQMPSMVRHREQWWALEHCVDETRVVPHQTACNQHTHSGVNTVYNMALHVHTITGVSIPPTAIMQPSLSCFPPPSLLLPLLSPSLSFHSPPVP